MKLWQKIFLWTLLTAMLVISISNILILKNNLKSSISREIDSTVSEHNYMISNLNNRIIMTRLQNSSILLSTKEITKVMEEVFDNTDTKETSQVVVLNPYAEFIYTNSRIEIDNNFLKTIFEQNETIEDDTVYRQIIKRDNKYLLYIASKVSFENQDFVFITVTNISSIYNLYYEQLNYTKVLTIVLSLSCGFFLLILVKILLLPLDSINHTTRQIAEGNYSQRIELRGNDELCQLSSNMNIMADSIEENVERLREVAENRKNFINNLAHEMKTPLTSILGFSDILRIKRNITPEEISEYSNIIFEEAKRLKNLSGKLMELITIGETNLELKNANIQDIFDKLSLVFRPTLENSQLELIVECENCSIRVDLELFESLIYNLIDNSIKASKKGDTIKLTGTFSNGVVEIYVEDSGIGIAKDELTKITEPFYMVDKARSREAGGAGLGLALCMRIAEIHNAKLEFESEPGKGTCVCISMKGDIADET